jgi:hypothetical protein
MIATGMTSQWYDPPFRARRNGGSPQKYCCARHRTAFHSAARQFAETAVSAGLLTIAGLKAGPAACRLRPSGVRRGPVG